MDSMRLNRRAVIAGALSAAALTPTWSRGQSSYLDGQTLTILAGFSTGSSGLININLFAEHLAKRLPTTQVVVRREGGDNPRIVDILTYEAAPDGLTIGTISPNLLHAVLQEEEQLDLDLAAYGYIAAMERRREILFVRNDTGIETAEQLLAHDAPLILPVRAATSYRYLQGLLLNVALGTRILPVPGYNAGAATLAILSGEAQLGIESATTAMDVLDGGGARPLLRIDDLPLPMHLPQDLPALRELPVAPEHAWILDLFDASSALRVVAAPPGVAADRLEILRGLFAEVLADPAFIEAARAVDFTVDPSGGAEYAAIVTRMLTDYGDIKEQLRAARDCGLSIAEIGRGSCKV